MEITYREHCSGKLGRGGAMPRCASTTTVNVRQLQIFSEVAKHQSFSKAAQSIRIAQPAISIAIKKLESDLDTILFNRDARNISLTPEGAALLKHAEKILAQVSEAKLEMLELKGMEKGDVSIAVPAMHGAYFFPDIVSGFMDRYPNIRIHAKEEGIQEIEQDLLSGGVDLGLVVAGQTSGELELEPLGDEEMVACVPPNHPRLKGPTVTMKQILKEPLIVLRSGYFLRDMIERAGEELEIRPNVVFDTNLFIPQLFKKLVRDGRGIGICLRLFLKGEQELQGLPFDPGVHLRMGIAWKRGRYLSAANRAFVDFVLSKTD